ncbi:hypothetical protein [Alysiella crassa]|uniref:hypothetical protein n=1 Tax=Alysiella crassa TaxID=153491 RepID=UPI001FD299C7|nr:hypothetical protein [Alysiella crassa]UOP07756.1 hypothetical protein LVJ80_05245 [Alysiella crassa]
MNPLYKSLLIYVGCVLRTKLSNYLNDLVRGTHPTKLKTGSLKTFQAACLFI